VEVALFVEALDQAQDREEDPIEIKDGDEAEPEAAGPGGIGSAEAREGVVEFVEPDQGEDAEGEEVENSGEDGAKLRERGHEIGAGVGDGLIRDGGGGGVP